MKYEEYLDKFCTEKTLFKRSGDYYDMGIPWRIRLKIWKLKLQGYLVKVRMEYYHSDVYKEKQAVKGKGHGIIRLFKYKSNYDGPIGLQIEEGKLNENK
ncbi:MAG: hypothetical protein ACW98D_18865 [Promethearchaeota archaeon]|jgi:hypothetical protein